MKMGLGLVLVGHVNFLLGALVHGAVLRHISIKSQPKTLMYAVSNVIVIVAGLVVSGGTRRQIDISMYLHVLYICLLYECM